MKDINQIPDLDKYIKLYNRDNKPKKRLSAKKLRYLERDFFPKGKDELEERLSYLLGSEAALSERKRA